MVFETLWNLRLCPVRLGCVADVFSHDNPNFPPMLGAVSGSAPFRKPFDSPGNSHKSLETGTAGVSRRI